MTSNIGSIGFTYVGGKIITDYDIVIEGNIVEDIVSSNVENTSNLFTENIDAIL